MEKSKFLRIAAENPRKVFHTLVWNVLKTFFSHTHFSHAVENLVGKVEKKFRTKDAFMQDFSA